jgi:mono/diheme cytochrome c family protein
MPQRMVRLFVALTLLLATAQQALPVSAAEPGKIDFNRDIRPILSNNCIQCHGPDAAERKGGTDGLRLDVRDGALADLGGYAAIVPGAPAKSALIERVSSTDPDLVMPPKESGKKLTKREIDLLTQWVKEGAHYAVHWSYAKPVRPALPAVKQTSWPKNEIDYFILARLEREGLSPSPEADRNTLIRRLSLDLTGLPPTVEEVEAFVADNDPQAYEKLVDRLLHKQAYGEHWAHFWLDLARYADSAGYADDPPRTIWLYRDYVIRSLNENKPFDQFTIEQIAGDLLPNPTNDQLIATAFHRNTLTNNEGGTNDEEFRNVAVVDRVNTTLAVWMGTTMACAQCHTHKFDPITQEEYFRFFAFFNNTEDADRTDESPLLYVMSPEQQKQKESWELEIASLEKQLSTPTPELLTAQTKWEQSLPKDLTWHSPKPTTLSSRENNPATIGEDSVIRLAPKPAKDVYTVQLPTVGDKLQALRLDVLPDPSLPGNGPGHSGGGNFVLSKLTAKVVPPHSTQLKGRYVRVENLGSGVFLHLAEVQAFRGNENVALAGKATQVSTDYDAPAELAIDGKTNGDFFKGKSVTHTGKADNPWWEVDLQSEQPLDRIVLWNRTDGDTAARLAKFRVAVLDEKRQVVWETTETNSPKPSREWSLSGERTIPFQVAFADYEQPGFAAANVLQPKPDVGWAIGGQPGQPHHLTLIAATPVELPPGSTLQVVLEQTSRFDQHTLGCFKLSYTGDAHVAELAKMPAGVLAILQTPADARSDAQRAELTKYFLSQTPQLASQREQLAKLKKQLADLKADTVPIMRELPSDKRRVTRIQHRGNFLDLGDEVTEGTPAAFHPLPADQPKNRLTLARWLVDENNPLTARVIANRYWEQIFGIGIVATSEEFGSQGEAPFHPELLDWLATELVRLKWDQKAMLKLLVTSAAYRQSSRLTPELAERDPDNRLLAAGPRVRLSAEMIRDQALAVSGLLSKKMYGPPVKPPQPSIGLNAAFGGGIDWQTSTGDDKYRRGLYTTWRRSNPYPSMAAFDAPNREVCTVRRSRTNTPLQALVTLNDPVYVEAAQALARRAIAEAGPTPANRVDRLFKLCLARPPREAETQRIVQLYEQALADFQQSPEEARKMATDPLGSPAANVDLADLAAWTVVSNVMLNLDEMFLKR